MKKLVAKINLALIALVYAFQFPSADALTVEEAIAAVEGAQDLEGRGFDRWTLAEVLAKTKVPGVSVAVIYEHQIHWAKGYGVADVETGRPVDTETIFQAASISKPVAAMATLRAVQDGVFGLGDDINTILTSWKLPDNEFTVEAKVTPAMLLSHTGGTTVHGFPGYFPDGEIPTAIQILEGGGMVNTAPIRVDRAPGTLWRYSGGGTILMQVALSDALGKPFPEIVRTVVLEPIGMTRSGYDQPLPPERMENAARAHSGRGERREAPWHVYPELAAAGNWTTPTDLCRFGIEVERSIHGRSNKVLSAEMAGLMIEPPGIGSYGLGLSVMKRGEEIYFGHGGSNYGFRCSLMVHRNNGYGAAVMTNSDRGDAVASEILKRVAKAYEWAGDFRSREEREADESAKGEGEKE